MLQKKNIELGDIILIRSGVYYIYVKTPTFDSPVFCRYGGYLPGLENYTDNLQFACSDKAYRDFDIVKVFKPKVGYISLKSINLACWDFPMRLESVFSNYQEIKKDKHFINLLEYV